MIDRSLEGYIEELEGMIKHAYQSTREGSPYFGDKETGQALTLLSCIRSRAAALGRAGSVTGDQNARKEELNKAISILVDTVANRTEADMLAREAESRVREIIAQLTGE